MGKHYVIEITGATKQSAAHASKGAALTAICQWLKVGERNRRKLAADHYLEIDGKIARLYVCRCTAPDQHNKELTHTPNGATIGARQFAFSPERGKP